MAGEQILVVEDQRAVTGALQMRLRGHRSRSWKLQDIDRIEIRIIRRLAGVRLALCRRRGRKVGRNPQAALCLPDFFDLPFFLPSSLPFDFFLSASFESDVDEVVVSLLSPSDPESPDFLESA